MEAPVKSPDYVSSQAIVKLIDMFGFTAFFTFAKNTLDLLFSQDNFLFASLLTFALPLSIALNIIQSGFSFADALHKKWRPHPTIRFVVEAFAALTTILFAVCLLTISSVLIPALFAAGTTAKALYNLGASFYYLDKAMDSRTEVKEKTALKKMIQHGLSFISYSLITAAVVVCAVGIPLMLPAVSGITAALGVTGAVLGLISATFQIAISWNRKEEAGARNNQPTTTTRLLTSLETAEVTVGNNNVTQMPQVTKSPVVTAHVTDNTTHEERIESSPRLSRA